MKQIVRNCFATTGLSLVLLVSVALCYDAEYLSIAGVFQTLLANIVIHGGMYQLKRFESPYVFVEILVEVSYIQAVVLGFGYLFDWYSSTPVWVLVFMVVVIYVVGGLIDVFRIKTDLEQINQALDGLRERISE